MYQPVQSHYDVSYFQENGLDNHMCKHGKNDKTCFKVTCLEYYCVLYDCWKQLILGKYVPFSPQNCAIDMKT